MILYPTTQIKVIYQRHVSVIEAVRSCAWYYFISVEKWRKFFMILCAAICVKNNIIWGVIQIVWPLCTQFCMGTMAARFCLTPPPSSEWENNQWNQCILCMTNENLNTVNIEWKKWFVSIHNYTINSYLCSNGCQFIRKCNWNVALILCTLPQTKNLNS